MSSKRKNTPTKLSKDEVEMDAVEEKVPDDLSEIKEEQHTPQSKKARILQSVREGSPPSPATSPAMASISPRLSPREQPTQPPQQPAAFLPPPGLPHLPSNGPLPTSQEPFAAMYHNINYFNAMSAMMMSRPGLPPGLMNGFNPFGNAAAFPAAAAAPVASGPPPTLPPPAQQLPQPQQHSPQLQPQQQATPKKNMETVLKKLTTSKNGVSASAEMDLNGNDVMETVRTAINSAQSVADKEKRLNQMIAQLQTMKQSLVEVSFNVIAMV